MVSESLKHFLIAVAKLHKQTGFDRLDSSKIHNKLDDYIKNDKDKRTKVQRLEKEKLKEQQTVLSRQESLIKDLHAKINNVSLINRDLASKLKDIASHNELLHDKIKDLEEIRLVKLSSKDKTKEPKLMTEAQFENLKRLKEQMDVLESRYSQLLTDETYDERLLSNYKERIELLKDKLKTMSKEDSFEVPAEDMSHFLKKKSEDIKSKASEIDKNSVINMSEHLDEIPKFD